MEKSFSVTLTELRKEKRLTQKEAAAKLGISQALLSHYEKGIRECSREFLIKAADFYGVSCDYLLGRTSERTGEIGVDINKAVPGDDELSAETLERAFVAVKEMLDRNKDERLTLLFAVELYRFILMGISAGVMPEKWAVNGLNPRLSQFLDISGSFMRSQAATLKVKGSAPKRKSVPLCVRTVAQSADEWLSGCLEGILRKNETEENN
ncbi:MAG: helix-turn-helix transcriptional regulator [Clostridia bacterium]|nr:helix-turn-helix transcriptional regulator [Clostridia bacterium]